MNLKFPLALAVVLLASAVQAEPGFSRLYKQQYGYTPSCNACHKDGGGTPNNAYGLQFKDAGESLAAFGKIAALDGDGDGAKNADEAAAKSNPGDAKSTPANKGAWLDTASLIPREVQALFPGVREYLPRDAVLTDADIARAKTLVLVRERTLQYQRQFGAAMTVIGNFCACRNTQQSHASVVRGFQNQLADAATNLAPFQTFDVTTHVILQWAREN